MDYAISLVGSCLPPVEGIRDAIHISVISARVPDGECFKAGDKVGYKDGLAAQAPAVGIIDPFLNGNARSGDTVWIFIFPREITSLRHVWEHPRFPNEGDSLNLNPEQTNAIEVLHAHAESLGMPLKVLLGAAKKWIETGEYTVQNGSTDWQRIFDEEFAECFWAHYELAMGSAVGEEKKRRFFSCSC